MATINLETEIIRRNRAVLEKEQVSLDEQKKLDAEVDRVLQNADAEYRNGLMSELGFDYKLAEAQAIQQERDSFSNLAADRIMDADAIKAICIEYGLRFLPTRFYKGALDAGIGPALESFKASMGGKLPVVKERELMRSASDALPSTPQFYICAPEESFVLRPVPKDPLLFCRLSAKKFFLLHKWGSDLDPKEAEARKGKITESNWNADTKEVSMQDFVVRQALLSQWGAIGHGAGGLLSGLNANSTAAANIGWSRLLGNR